MSEIEARLEKLETTIAYQDETIEELNKAVTDLWQQLEALRRDMSKLTEQLREVEGHPALAAQDEPPPPHY
ncbi:SlyX family protein [Paradevosia shaoguanensis]|jgi:SlyX protein|uniref:Protein SlyX homolog n=1 Tax=Paradevosia shaoguanensis TaxID=1335043 RepID=A0AA41QPX4_9HYPH|nr:SlyX family protein [Paradevosia shaoguanensis]KFL28677.1 hypothetical protein JP74_01995 [Devosia sp. 17-2-E-8]MBI4045251.1 SlyX family protein [Devosia nanyangense]QMV01569.1 SlyX protein [Devosia sp. D6-9]MCF1743023.1 SlyX family protein [Paradevosia shaoguanensis]MCI0127506.1 SlyX family protein [Paradevosia shaoguanensis]